MSKPQGKAELRKQYLLEKYVWKWKQFMRSRKGEGLFPRLLKLSHNNWLRQVIIKKKKIRKMLFALLVSSQTGKCNFFKKKNANLSSTFCRFFSHLPPRLQDRQLALLWRHLPQSPAASNRSWTCSPGTSLNRKPASLTDMLYFELHIHKLG